MLCNVRRRCIGKLHPNLSLHCRICTNPLLHSLSTTPSWVVGEKTPSYSSFLHRMSYSSMPQKGMPPPSPSPSPSPPPSPSPSPSLRALSEAEVKGLVEGQFSGGKYHNLVERVVCVPGVILSAYKRIAVRCGNAEVLRDVLGKAAKDGIDEHWLLNTCLDIKKGAWKVESECIYIPDHEHPLPTLKLRVLMESLAVVLRTIYEPTFADFAFGAKIGTDRHCALKYVKDDIVDASWAFSVKFKDTYYGCRITNTKRLFYFMRKRIEDSLLFRLIRDLFKTNVLRIRIGGFSLGKGLPEECVLSALLLNIHLSNFDHQMDCLRRSIEEEEAKKPISPVRLQKEEGIPVSRQVPVRIYLCRYLDGILVATSGTKEVLRKLRSKAMLVLIRDLCMGVDAKNSLMHNITEERVDFLGMYVQSVPPSKLRPVMHEKHKRYLRKKLRIRMKIEREKMNAKEAMLKKLGFKVFRHVVKKFRHGQYRCPERDCGLASKVSMVFREWAQDVVIGFIGKASLERWYLHRHLSASRFLFSDSVRDNLPKPLLESYEVLLEKVDKYMKTDNIFEQGPTPKEIALEKEYHRQIVRDMIMLRTKVRAPRHMLYRAVKYAGIVKRYGRPQPIELLYPLDDEEIVRWYSGIAMRVLRCFCLCNDFKAVRTIVGYHMRFSCILTIKDKHGCSKKEALRYCSRNLRVRNSAGRFQTIFPPDEYIGNMQRQHVGAHSKPYDDLIDMTLVRLPTPNVGDSYRCTVLCCDSITRNVFQISLLHCRKNISLLDFQRRIGISGIHDSFHKKCLPLCDYHIKLFYKGEITLQDIDYAFIYNSTENTESQ